MQFSYPVEFACNYKATQNRTMIVQDFLCRKCRGICMVAK